MKITLNYIISLKTIIKVDKYIYFWAQDNLQNTERHFNYSFGGVILIF